MRAVFNSSRACLYGISFASSNSSGKGRISVPEKNDADSQVNRDQKSKRRATEEARARIDPGKVEWKPTPVRKFHSDSAWLASSIVVKPLFCFELLILESAPIHCLQSERQTLHPNRASGLTMSPGPPPAASAGPCKRRRRPPPHGVSSGTCCYATWRAGPSAPPW